MVKEIEIVEVATINGNRQTVEGSGFFGKINDGETVEEAILREAKGGSWKGRDYEFQLEAFEVDADGRRIDGEVLATVSL